MKSIKAKLILLGAVSIICTIILGITGIYIMNNSTANSRILNDINSINVHQKENSNAELSFLRDYDISHYDTVEENLNVMLKAADDAISCSTVEAYVEKLNSISSDIGKAINNTIQLKEMLEYRGFKAGEGLYDAYTGMDEEIAEYISWMAQESEWADGVWQSVNLSEGNSTTVNGKSYKKAVYVEEIPVYAKRNTLSMRIGAYGATYSGKIYITDIRFDDVSVDLAKVSSDVLASSYGDALEKVQLSEFQGKDCIEIDSSFVNNNGAWQEALINVDISGYDYTDCSSLSCVMYFADEEKAKFSVALCMDGKYAIGTNFELLNKNFEEYSSLVAEGKEIEKYVADNKALISEMIAKAPLYTMYPDTAEGLAAALIEKSDAMDRITEYDKSIVVLMTENRMANESLSQYAEEVKVQIENMTEAQKKAMSAAIYLVFAVGAVLVIILTLFVILSVQKSINQFEGTLGLITDGDITIKARTDNQNEFDTFGRALNNMTDKLSEVMGDTAACAAQLNSAGSELENMSKSCENISEKLELSISGIAQGANEQALDVETSTGEISRLGTLMNNMNGNIKELDETAIDMKQAGKGAMGILDELGSSNEHMTECIGRIEEQIAKTNDSVKDIENAVALISSIADQTNLLSLNASIEAARAGEAGRGFAVVASEIQQLAEQSNNSANTVFGVISNLIEDFKEILEIMKEVKEATSQQNDKLLQTQKQFETVNIGITQSRDKTAVIRNAIDECSNACASVSKIMMNLSAISEENAASTTEAATAMQNLNGTITTLLQEARKLLSLSAKLDDGIKFFKLCN